MRVPILLAAGRRSAARPPWTRHLMTGATQLRLGVDRFQIVPWRGVEGIALVTPVPGGPVPDVESVRRCVDVLAGWGVSEVITGAMPRAEQAAFLAAGFAVREHLHLLAHDLRDIGPAHHPSRIRRVRRTDRAAILDVDHRAFETFWRLDDAGIDDALGATATSRFRLAADREPVGYAITGRAGRRGYLQRLAVDPDRQRRGIATALILDGLGWLRRHGVTQAVVNTQEHNVVALAVYERLGFHRLPDGLAVLARPTDGHP